MYRAWPVSAPQRPQDEMAERGRDWLVRIVLYQTEIGRKASIVIGMLRLVKLRPRLGGWSCLGCACLRLRSRFYHQDASAERFQGRIQPISATPSNLTR